ncbi:hypothetical protein [Paraburkholderia sp. SIMBA_054]|uniref:hypothetical protein n=1 Tax=Paraburkholderia sp. SIMBA_054 TaxID=3085795 RepID=UPI00397AB515
MSQRLSPHDELFDFLSAFAAFFQMLSPNAAHSTSPNGRSHEQSERSKSPVEHGQEMQSQSNLLDIARQFLADRRRASRSRKLEAHQILIKDLLGIDFKYADIAAYLAKYKGVHVSRQAVRAHCLKAAANAVSEPAIQHAAGLNRPAGVPMQQQVPGNSDGGARGNPSSPPTPGESKSAPGTHSIAPNAAQKDVLFRTSHAGHVDYDVSIGSADSQAESPAAPVARRFDKRLHEVLVTSNPASGLKDTINVRRFEQNGKPADLQPLNTGNTQRNDR